ncbi:hypothetical protein [Carnobacterium sp. ISL-102]|nr:hypothetical protein [Carnobacterium sp. ISL-102]
MLNTAIAASLIIGWFLGFVSYYGFKTGYKLLMEVLLEEEK